MYVAVKGGEEAIANAHELLAEKRRGDPAVEEIEVAQIEQQLGLAVDRVMTEGSLYDRDLAALALKQAQGDAVEAIFLLRAYRTTLPRFGVSEPVDTGKMTVSRRISATFKDLPGGQILGPTYDYTHRLLDFSLVENGRRPGTTGTGGAAQNDEKVDDTGEPHIAPVRVTELLDQRGLIEHRPTSNDDCPVGDLTRDPLRIPSGRDVRLQNLVRGDEGFLLSLGYSVVRGYGANQHPFAAEIRCGEVTVEFTPPELGFPIEIGEITLTECTMVNRYPGSDGQPPCFTEGYGMGFGRAERKAMSMALVDRALRGRELKEHRRYPAQDEEFVLYHSDNVEASGFVQHLKLPHYVDFQAELVLIKGMRNEWEKRNAARDGDGEDNGGNDR